MAKQENLELNGVVSERLKGGKFKVEIEVEGGNKHEMICTLAGKMTVYNIRVIPGDKVTVEASPYDLTKGRIIWRDK